MAIKRREFLKIAGLSTILEFGGKAAFEMFGPGELKASQRTVLPAPGKKWGMVVNMSEMDEEIMARCIEACHHTHNVPNFGNTKEEIKWIWKEKYEHSFPGQEHEYIAETAKERDFLLFCNHCTNPPCCRVCPTRATWKREEDGVVMMDQHRCIGCRFCMAACPYGARSFNWGDPRKAPKRLNPGFPTNPRYPTRAKGVVEKCNFCAERLAKGKLPACVEAAGRVKADALTFGDLDDPGSGVRELLRKHYTIRRRPELGTGPNIYYIV